MHALQTVGVEISVLTIIVAGVQGVGAGVMGGSGSGSAFFLQERIIRVKDEIKISMNVAFFIAFDFGVGNKCRESNTDIR